MVKEIAREVKVLKSDKGHCNIQICKETAAESACDIIFALLVKISPKLDRTLPAILIGNIITSLLTNSFTILPIALGVLMKDSEDLVNHFYDFGVTFSYDEILRFHAATTQYSLSGISDNHTGLVQANADYFDADISQNRKLSTHSLTLLLTQQQIKCDPQEEMDQTIRRIKKTNMSTSIPYELRIHEYEGPKKTPMLTGSANKIILPLKIMAYENIPEFNGYTTKLCRLTGLSVSPRNKAVYMPLIDMPHVDHITIMTALIEANRLTTEAGQEFNIFTCDQQLYRLSLQVIWAYPEQFSNVVLRLGGMHMLMSFVGAVGSLMEESGQVEVMNAGFSGVAKMLNGKKFPQNVRALRIIVEELLRKIIQDSKVASYDEIMWHLDDISGNNRAAKLWVNIVIKSVFIMMLYIRAERECDWPLHLEAVKQMMPYFYASGHVNYARYGLFYL